MDGRLAGLDEEAITAVVHGGSDEVVEGLFDLAATLLLLLVATGHGRGALLVQGGTWGLGGGRGSRGGLVLGGLLEEMHGLCFGFRL